MLMSNHQDELDQYRSIFWEELKIDDGKETLTGDYFELEADPKKPNKILLNKPDNGNILMKTGNIRKKMMNCISLRGTSKKYMDEAKSKGLISAHSVSNWFEDDCGEVAHYVIPILSRNVSERELIYRLGISTIGAIRWAFEHGNILIPTESKIFKKNGKMDNFIYSLSGFYEKKSEDSFPEFVLFYNLKKPGREENVEYVMNEIKNNRHAIGNFTYYLQSGGGSFKVEFNGKFLKPFKEGRGIYNSDKNNDLFATYCEANKKNILNIFEKLLNENTREREILQNIEMTYHKNDSNNNLKEGTKIYALEDAVLYLVSEKIVFDLFDNMNKMATENNHLF